MKSCLYINIQATLFVLSCNKIFYFGVEFVLLRFGVSEVLIVVVVAVLVTVWLSSQWKGSNSVSLLFHDGFLEA